VGPEASRLILDLAVEMAQHGKGIVLASVQAHPRFVRFLEEGLDRRRREALIRFPDIDHALEWCEDRVIDAQRGTERESEKIRLADHPLCRGLPEDAVRALEAILERRTFERGALLVARGDTSRELYFVLRGEVSVSVPLADGQRRRLATLGPGMGFGELSVISGGERSADVRADSAVECLVLGYEAFERLGARGAAGEDRAAREHARECGGDGASPDPRRSPPSPAETIRRRQGVRAALITVSRRSSFDRRA
jgi:glutaminase